MPRRTPGYNAVASWQQIATRSEQFTRAIWKKSQWAWREQLRLCALALIGTWAALSLCPCPAAAQSDPPDEPAANPARPTVATPATLTPVGYLQFETGVQGSWHSPEFSSRFGVNEVIKLSVAPRLELIASDEPWAHFHADGQPGNGPGGLLLGGQTVLSKGEGATPTFAVSYLHQFYGGTAPDLDFGSPNNSILLLASADVKGFHYDANALFNEVTEGSVRRLQFGQTISISHALKGPFSLTGELWHFPQPFLQNHAVGTLWSIGYTPRKTLVFDAGFDRGLTSTSTRWEVFAGFTYLLPHRLF